MDFYVFSFCNMWLSTSKHWKCPNSFPVYLKRNERVSETKLRFLNECNRQNFRGDHAYINMLQDSMFSAFSNDNFLKQTTMENYASYNSSHSSFSFSSGLEFNAFRTKTFSSPQQQQLQQQQQHHLPSQQNNQLTQDSLLRNTDKLLQRQANLDGSLLQANNNRQGETYFLIFTIFFHTFILGVMLNQTSCLEQNNLAISYNYNNYIIMITNQL